MRVLLVCDIIVAFAVVVSESRDLSQRRSYDDVTILRRCNDLTTVTVTLTSLQNTRRLYL